MEVFLAGICEAGNIKKCWILWNVISQVIAFIVKGRHLCKEMRGARKKGEMTCSYLVGKFKTDAALRAELMNFV